MKTTYAIAAGAALVAVFAAGCSSQSTTSDTPSAAGSAAANGSAAAGSTAGAPASSTPGKGDINQAVPNGNQKTLAPVPSTKPAPFGNGVSVQVVSTKAVKIAGKGPGELSGSGYAITLRLSNGSKATIPLDSVTVAASFGSANTPAEGTTRPPTAPFTGSLKPGDSASGTYAFVVPGAASDIRLTITYSTSAPAVVIDL